MNVIVLISLCDLINYLNELFFSKNQMMNHPSK